jgi:hypothetical protein
MYKFILYNFKFIGICCCEIVVGDRNSELYNTKRLSREENVYVIKLMGPIRFEAAENM